MSLKHRNITSTILIFSCLDRVLQLYQEDVVFSVNTGYSPKTPSIQYRTELNCKYVYLIRPKIYVIEYTDDDLGDILQCLEYCTFFNPAALFILIVDFVDSQIVNVLTRYFIYSFVIVEYSGTDSKTFYGMPSDDPSTNFTEPVKIGQCTSTTMSLTKIMVERMPSTYEWDNPVLKIGLGHSPPYIIQESPGGPFKGVDIDIVEFIAARMKFKPEYAPTPNFVGNKKNITYDGILGLLARKSAGMVMGGIFATKDSYLDFAISYPIHRTTYSWFVPGPIFIPFWRRMLLIFQPTVSLAIISFYILMTIVQFVFNRLNSKGGYAFYDEFFKLYSSSVSAPIRVAQTEEYSKKIFYICWFLFWLILNASFSSKLLENLIQTKYYFPIDSLETLNEIKLEVCILKDLEFSLKGYGGRVMTCEDCADCLNRTAHQKDLVTVRNTDLVDFYKSKYYVNSLGDPLIFALKEKYFAIYNVMIFRKNHPIFRRFNEILRRMISSGIIARMRQKYKTFLSKSPKVEKKWRILQMNRLKFIFQFWLYGLIFSSLVFVLEIVLSKHDVSIQCEN
ncbi:uncharacterized protein LOC123683014 [Harmonia axyridis]|uniref:uncharacterized protein LOC123683014 n=1 Tax=Harmonia axyridis TaxID=115357 RepID=UPI001E278C64|nr:uncharacterized protein LOC123683014 [Harmonia axyridis]